MDTVPSAPKSRSGAVPEVLGERDADYIARTLPFTWPLIAAWFRLAAQRRWPIIG